MREGLGEVSREKKREEERGRGRSKVGEIARRDLVRVGEKKM